MKTDECAILHEIAPYLLGEGSAAQRAKIANHIKECTTCRTFHDEQTGLINQLRAYEGTQTVDVRSAVFDKIVQKKFTLLIHPGWLRAAALLIAAAGITLMLRRGDFEPATASAADRQIHASLEWLAAHQNHDGSWSPSEWNGRESFKVGLTAAAMLGFVEAGLISKFQQQCDNTVKYLLKQQAPDGSFGEDNEVRMYNHALATYALLRYSGFSEDGQVSESLERALHFITDNQDAFGGWGYVSSGRTTQPNSAITLWQLQVLHAAREAGWHDAKGSYNRGLLWLESVIDQDGRPGYRYTGDTKGITQAMTAAAAICLFQSKLTLSDSPQLPEKTLTQVESLLGCESRINDLYESFWLAKCLQAIRVSRRADDGVRLHQRRLTPLYVEHGDLSGSWNPDSLWGKIGGRLYSTVFGVLALNEIRRHDSSFLAGL